MDNLKDKITPVLSFDESRTPAQIRSADGLFEHNRRIEEDRIMREHLRKRYDDIYRDSNEVTND